MIDTRLTVGFQRRSLAIATQANRTVGLLAGGFALETWAQRLRMRTALSLRGRIAHKAKLRAPRPHRRRAIHASSPLSAEPPRKQPQHNKHNCTKITGCPVLEARRRRRRVPTARRATARRRPHHEARRRSATRATEFQTAPRRRASGHQPEARGGRARARRRRAARLRIGSSPTGRAWILMKPITLYLWSRRRKERRATTPRRTRGPSRSSFGGPCGRRCCRGRRAVGDDLLVEPTRRGLRRTRPRRSFGSAPRCRTVRIGSEARWKSSRTRGKNLGTMQERQP